MRMGLIALLLFSCQTAHSQLRTQPASQTPFSVHLALVKAAEIETIQKMTDRLRAGDRSLCHYDHHVSVSKCALPMIRAYRIHSSQALRALLDLSVSLAICDRAHKFSEIEINRDLAENFLAVAENARPDKFFAAHMVAKTRQDRLEKTQSLIAENAALEGFRLEVIPLIGSQIAKAGAGPLRLRAENLRVRRWALR